MFLFDMFGDLLRAHEKFSNALIDQNGIARNFMPCLSQCYLASRERTDDRNVLLFSLCGIQETNHHPSEDDKFQRSCDDGDRDQPNNDAEAKEDHRLLAVEPNERRIFFQEIDNHRHDPEITESRDILILFDIVFRTESGCPGWSRSADILRLISIHI